jgi:hypothetical protein
MIHSIFADTVKLKDGSEIKGRVLRITQQSIEIDPDGEIPFDLIQKEKADSIVFPDGRIMTLQQKEENKQPVSGGGKINSAEKNKPQTSSHDAFYFRFLYGPAYERVLIDAPDDIEIKGCSLIMSFQFGYTLLPDFVITGNYGVNVGPSHFTTDDPGIRDLKKYEYDSFTYGIGFTYFIMPENYSFSTIISRYYGSLEKSDTSENSIFRTKGVSMMFVFAKEWMLSQNWGLGISLIYSYSHALTERKYFGHRYGVSDFSYGIAFSATYN